jgi:hypothetical protein
VDAEVTDVRSTTIVKVAKLAVVLPAVAAILLAEPAQARRPVITHPARIVAENTSATKASTVVRGAWTSTNWSGYARTGTFAGITATWTVPAVQATPAPGFSASWIGIDGFENSSLIQAGTEQDYFGGAVHYDAWWEILPAAETTIPVHSYPVGPGDRMSASIYETTTIAAKPTTGHVWVIDLADSTKGWKYSATEPYAGPGASAEWILEAPEVNGAASSLAHYSIAASRGAGDFDSAGVLSAPVAKGTPVFASAKLTFASQAGTMIKGAQTISIPGQPDASLNAFDMAYGSTLPTTPAR